MPVNNIIKRIQNIMRSDAGINGDSQRIEQMVWIMFLKVYDAQEEDWEIDDDHYQSIIPEPLRWRNWAHSKDEQGRESNDALTGDSLLEFIDRTLFPVLKGADSADKTIKGIKVTRETPRGKAIVHEVFTEVNQYMKNGTLLRQMINVIDEVDLLDSEECHAFGDIYEGILKDLQGAGNAGEFYTPRALTDFIVEMLNPQLGERFGDFAAGTGGFDDERFILRFVVIQFVREFADRLYRGVRQDAQILFHEPFMVLHECRQAGKRRRRFGIDHHAPGRRIQSVHEPHAHLPFVPVTYLQKGQKVRLTGGIRL